MDEKTRETIREHKGYDKCEHHETRRHCPDCKHDVPAYMRKKDAGIAAVLSWLVPGLGHVYLGKVGRGLAWFFGSIIGLFLFIIPGVVIWIFNIIDAYKQAKKQ